MIRKHYILNGSVQGVGLRYRAYYAASEVGVTGWVKNNDNGSVELEVQGTEEMIDRFFSLIKKGRYIYIDDIKSKVINIDEEERSFGIKDY